MSLVVLSLHFRRRLRRQLLRFSSTAANDGGGQNDDQRVQTIRSHGCLYPLKLTGKTTANYGIIHELSFKGKARDIRVENGIYHPNPISPRIRQSPTFESTGT